MLLGIDFDNTIVCYDQVFHRAAIERGLIPETMAPDKFLIRNHLRNTGNEDAWTALQGYVYGPGMANAPAFAGVIEFLTKCAQEGIAVRIISHKTRYPFLGPQYDLHEAATDWLRRHEFFSADGINLSPAHVHFGLTKEDKLAQIRESRCTHFVDDLPEFLSESEFPAGVDRILFDPAGNAPTVPFQRAASWLELEQLLLDAMNGDLQTSVGSLLRSIGAPNRFTLHPIIGGGNNRVFRVETDGKPLLLKQYFYKENDRDRLRAEFEFSQFAWKRGVRSLPEPLAREASARLAVYEFVDGSRPTTATVDHVCAAAGFFRAVNVERDEARNSLPLAAEACFSLAGHAECIGRRVEVLSRLQPRSDVDAAAADLVQTLLQPAWIHTLDESRSMAREFGLEWNAQLPDSERRLSPSDFGFHNSLVRPNGEVVFLDFEYAGWDDPAKLVADFFYQPSVPVPPEFRDGFSRAISDVAGEPQACMHRVAVIAPLYRLKWVCILLNDFLPAASARRRFAQSAVEEGTRKLVQLRKARAALAAA